MLHSLSTSRGIFNEMIKIVVHMPALQKSSIFLNIHFIRIYFTFLEILFSHGVNLIDHITYLTTICHINIFSQNSLQVLLNTMYLKGTQSTCIKGIIKVISCLHFIKIKGSAHFMIF